MLQPGNRINLTVLYAAPLLSIKRSVMQYITIYEKYPSYNNNDHIYNIKRNHIHGLCK